MNQGFQDASKYGFLCKKDLIRLKASEFLHQNPTSELQTLNKEKIIPAAAFSGKIIRAA